MTNTATETKARTYVTTSSGRGDSEVGPHSLTYTDVIDFDAREVRWSVVGYSDGGTVNHSGVRPFGPEFTGDPDSVDRARLAHGWRRVSEVSL